MKKTTKIALGAVAVMAVSAGVAGVTTYTLMQSKQDKNTSFYDEFQTATNTRYAALDAANMQPVDLTKAAESSLNSVVHIMSVQRSKVKTIQGQPDIFDFFFGDGRGREQQVQTPEQRGFGSGVIISKDGYIATNNHVIDGADEISVKLHDGREMKGRVIGADPTTDLALVKIEGDDFPAIPVGDSDRLKVGEWVLAVGNPFNLGSTVTAGIASAKARGLGANGVESFIQTDAAINQGNSGGALVNAKGELVGINAMLVSPTGAYSGYGFAIPTSIMTKVVTDLKQYGTVQRAILGVLMMSVGDIADQLSYPNLDSKLKDELTELKSKIKVSEGACVSDFAERSSAKEAGIEKGDVIIAVNGAKVKNANALQEQISKYRPGDKVEITVDRNGSNKKFTVELRNAQGSTSVVKSAGDSSADVLGAAFKALTDKQKRELGVSYGIEVTGLLKGKLRDAGIQKGFVIMIVNDQKISTPEQLEKLVDKVLKGNADDRYIVVKGFYPNGRTKVYAIDLAE